MPRYFFHLHNHLDCVDREGAELPGIEAAQARAIASARGIMAENVTQGEMCLSHWIEVVDELGAAVLKVRFGDAVKIVP